MIRIALLALSVAAPAAAQEPAFDPGPTKACLSRALTEDAQRGCIGLGAELCMSGPAGGSTVGMGYCLTAEWEYWDGRLNAVYGQLRAAEKAADVDMASDRFTPPSRADALLQMQRAWIPWRDATCAYEYAQFGGGTGGGPASAACLMRLTGAQALYLDTMLGQR